MKWKKITPETEFDKEKIYLLRRTILDKKWEFFYLMEYCPVLMVWKLGAPDENLSVSLEYIYTNKGFTHFKEIDEPRDTDSPR